MSDPLRHSGTGEVRLAHRFDEQKLFEWMRENVDGFAGPLTVEQFNGGQSNPTYRLTTPTVSYVLRRKPPGNILPGAHAIEREARILQALKSADFPVPRVHAVCVDERVIGAWFYVMEFIEGRIVWDLSFPDVPRADRPLYFDAMNSTLARLHRVDFASIGLADYGKPGNYFARQISRWTAQYVKDIEAGRDAHLDRLIEWLPAHIPTDDDVGIVHGDYRSDNLIFHPVEARVIAVLDWELSTLGHPLADFTYHLMMYRMPFSLFAGLKGHDLAELNIPSESEYVDAYCRRTGRDGISDLDFYIVFNMFRLAAIFHGIKGRLIRGNAASAHAADAAAKLPLIAEQAWLQTGAV
jgi:aminoglycoside phosphotransferase (APT) family kinase protein